MASEISTMQSTQVISAKLPKPLYFAIKDYLHAEFKRTGVEHTQTDLIIEALEMRLRMNSPATSTVTPAPIAIDTFANAA